jgi:hypothetical protein
MKIMRQLIALEKEGSNEKVIPPKKINHLLKKQYVINHDDKPISTWARSEKDIMNKLGPTLLIKGKHK